MRLLFITHSLASGGTDRVAVHLANGFAKVCDTTLLNVRRSTPPAALVEMIDPEVDRVSLERESGSRALDLVKSAAELVRHVRCLKPDLIIATGNNNSLFSMIGHLANPNPKRRFAVKLTNPIVRGKDRLPRRIFRTALYRLVLGRCARILVLSPGIGGNVASLYPALADRIRVTFNPYVTPAMLIAPEQDDAAGRQREFLVIGRLHSQKNLPLLLKAWVIARPANFRLRIAGDGPLRDTLVAQVAALGIARDVDFLGYQSDIAGLLRTAHCLVLSSDYEGLPAVVLEAFAAGCPVISTDSFPAAAELVGTAPGCRVVPCQDAPALAAAICEVAAQSGSTATTLQQWALPYTIENAIASHREALSI